VLYHRTSGVSDLIEDKAGLMTWYGRQAILGLVLQPELFDSAKADPSEKNLKVLAPMAHKAAGSERAADTGTLIHSLTERVDAGQELPETPFLPLLEAYRELTAELEVLETELFVVQDEIQT